MDQSVPLDAPAARRWLETRPWIDDESVDIEQHLWLHRPGLEPQLRTLLRQWRTQGFVVLKQVVPLPLIDALNADLVHFQEQFAEYTVPMEIRGQQLSSRDLDRFPADSAGVKINQFHCFSRAAALLGINEAVTRFLSLVFEGPASVCQSLTFWKGSEQAVHIDFPYVRQQSRLPYLAASWIPLEDVHPDSGPLAYYPGGHRLENVGLFDWGNGSIVYDEHSTRSPTDFAGYLAGRMERSGIPPTVFCPQRGDVLIWHANLPHEGTPMRDPGRTRKSLVTHYTSEADLPDWMRNHDAAGKPVGVFGPHAYSWRYPWFNEVRRLAGWEGQIG